MKREDIEKAATGYAKEIWKSVIGYERLGEIMGYSKERIRQLEDSALSKIREKKELQHFRDFIED